MEGGCTDVGRRVNSESRAHAYARDQAARAQADDDPRGPAKKVYVTDPKHGGQPVTVAHLGWVHQEDDEVVC